MRTLFSALLFFFTLLLGLTSYALPFIIVHKAGTQLPTTVASGSTVMAYYTVTNNTSSERKGNFIKYLPGNKPNQPSHVTPVYGNNGTYPGTCEKLFDLAPQSGCTLQLAVTGDVHPDLSRPENNLIVCFPGGLTCAGTTEPLNVVQTPSPVNQLTAITISPNTSSLPGGRPQQMTAIGTYSDGSTQDISSSVTWSSSAPSVATISVSGQVTGLATGSSNISASLNAISSNTAVFNVQSFVYIVDNITNNDTMYCALDNNGNLLPPCNRTGSNNNSIYKYSGIAINPNVTYAYLADLDNGINYCSINVDGTFGTCNLTGSNLYAPAQIKINSAGTYAYIANSDINGFSSLIYCSIESNGSLSNCNSTGSGLPTNFNSLTINPAGTYVYIADGTNNIYACPVQSDGSVSTCNIATSAITNPKTLSFNRLGNYAYVATSANSTASIFYCAVNNNATFNNCIPTTALNPTSRYNGITVNPINTLAYIIQSHVSNQADSFIYNCLVNNNGNLTNCNSTDLGNTIAPIDVVIP